MLESLSMILKYIYLFMFIYIYIYNTISSAILNNCCDVDLLIDNKKITNDLGNNSV